MFRLRGTEYLAIYYVDTDSERHGRADILFSAGQKGGEE